MNTVFDFAIVGAGIAGASLAHALAPQASVLLLEAEAQAGVHSTGRSAAMFMESYGPPQARALTRASRAFLQAPPAGFASVPLVAPRGALYAAWQGQEARLEALHDGLLATGTAVARLDASAALARVPVLRAQGLLGAVWEADALDVDVDALHQGYLRSARRAGAQSLLAAPLQRAQRGDGVWTLHLGAAHGLRHARVLVDAAGAWADEVAQRCGVAPLGIEPRRRSAFTFEVPAGIDARAWPTTAGVTDDWYIKPDAGQLLGSPANADPVAAHDVQPEELDIARGIDAIQRDTTLSIRRPRRAWAGLRSFTRDGELAIGFDARERGFFWLAGQGGYGIQSSCGASQLAASLLLGQALPDALAVHGVTPALMDPARLRAA
ncbi:MAG TPA: FAD-dependent oxidoreductase [Rubrivivax sp.]|nr:FAD-dependent oxidoreductase [Rubrivivax sp.]